MSQLNEDQQSAVAAFDLFMDDDDATIFALLGYAGTGKTYTLSHLMRGTILGGQPAENIFACPTHKAMNVGRRFLAETGVGFEIGYDQFHHQWGRTVTGTTAQLLGIRPVIADDQTSKKQSFGKVTGGMIAKMGDVPWIIIDEVSMLSRAQLVDVSRTAAGMGGKVLVVGDPGQLPPVEQEAIRFEEIEYRATLERIMRQQGDSAIPHLAQAVRNLTNWKKVQGPGVDHFHNPAGAFLDEIDGPPAFDERERSIFVAYRNARVNAVQEAACRKVYGHGRLDFAAGEVVIASRPLMAAGGTAALCANGDVLRIEEIGDQGEWGLTMRVSNEKGGGFWCEFLNDAMAGDPGHPFNIELRSRRERANALQQAYNKGDRSVNDERRRAWARFFQLENSTVLSAAHCFAITSHKSQGSTYRAAFVDAQDMEGFDHRALYVASTRPSEELIIG